MASSSRNRLFGNFDVQLMVFLPVASLRPQLHTLLSSPSIGACPLCLVWLLKKVETVRSVLPHAASHHQHVLDIDMDVYFVRNLLSWTLLQPLLVVGFCPFTSYSTISFSSEIVMPITVSISVQSVQNILYMIGLAFSFKPYSAVCRPDLVLGTDN